MLAALARAPSALVTTTRSASSITPRLMPWSSSPPPGDASSINMSTMSETAYSDWPTPTVSTSTTENPAASHSAMASEVLRATPPRMPRDGVDRMNAFGFRLSSVIRVRSPRIDPPVRADDGSTARTARRSSRSASQLPKPSMNVDLPTPGAPEIPMRSDGLRSVCALWSASTRESSSRPASSCLGCVDSIRVMPFARAARSPATIRSASSAGKLDASRRAPRARIIGRL
eukprot:Amastigsp_a177488_33.p2 type:complete len:230 gc:universal Amastigsp_a177488_33:381-1070(+)